MFLLRKYLAAIVYGIFLNLTGGQFGDFSTLELSEDCVVFLFGDNWFLRILKSANFTMQITAKD